MTGFVAAVMAVLFAFPAMAQFLGPCGNCHTMHNSQNGDTVVGAGPNPQLLKGDCVGCHSAADGSTAIDPVTGAPIVYNTSQPTYGADAGDGKKQGLAGGNFYWVDQDDTFGHNIFTSDSNLDGPPGGSNYCFDGSNACHENLDRPYAYGGHLQGRSGCLGCHMVTGSSPMSPSITAFHHKTDDGIVDSPEEGWYRFLSGHINANGRGVSGIEDDDWQLTASATDHNEYLGADIDKTREDFILFVADTMTGYCCGCHGDFHKQKKKVNGKKWFRHPSDTPLPSDSEYAGYTVYDPLTPVARTSLSAVSGVVTPGTDMVMCLSCHRAHASPYPDMLRFPYDQMQAGGGGLDGVGCFKCHTWKDGS